MQTLSIPKWLVNPCPNRRDEDGRGSFDGRLLSRESHIADLWGSSASETPTLRKATVRRRPSHLQTHSFHTLAREHNPGFATKGTKNFLACVVMFHRAIACRSVIGAGQLASRSHTPYIHLRISFTPFRHIPSSHLRPSPAFRRGGSSRDGSHAGWTTARQLLEHGIAEITVNCSIQECWETLLFVPQQSRR